MSMVPLPPSYIQTFPTSFRFRGTFRLHISPIIVYLIRTRFWCAKIHSAASIDNLTFLHDATLWFRYEDMMMESNRRLIGVQLQFRDVDDDDVYFYLIIRRNMRELQFLIPSADIQIDLNLIDWSSYFVYFLNWIIIPICYWNAWNTEIWICFSFSISTSIKSSPIRPFINSFNFIHKFLNSFHIYSIFSPPSNHPSYDFSFFLWEIQNQNINKRRLDEWKLGMRCWSIRSGCSAVCKGQRRWKGRRFIHLNPKNIKTNN